MFERPAQAMRGKLALSTKSTASSKQHTVAATPILDNNNPPVRLHPAPAPPTPAWTTVGNKRDMLRKTVLNGQASRYGAPSMAAGIRNMNINAATTARPRILNPSEAPPPTIIGQQHRGPDTVFTQHTYDPIEKPVYDRYCVLTDRRRRDFAVGQVIALPYHKPNTNPDYKVGDVRLRSTCEGPVYSKRRMFVILWMTKQAMFCAPLFSFGSRGILAKPDGIRDEFVELVNESAKDTFKKVGKWPPVVFVGKPNGRPLTDETTVHVTGGMMVGFKEDISFVGRLTKASHQALLTLWQRMNQGVIVQEW